MAARMDDSHASDEDLMLRLQKRRDEEAFTLLFARYRVPITSYLYRLVGDRSDAEALAQDGFLRVLEKADLYKYPKRFSTWFYTIARNLATDFLKKKRAVVPDDFHALSESVLSPGRPEADDETSWREELDQLAAAIQELPLPYREVVILRDLQGLSYREIAAIVGCPESTARSRMDYGLEFLRKRYRQRGGGKSAAADDETPP
jgi:RNA polymerase sigma-70 factor (ECF subfamily)